MSRRKKQASGYVRIIQTAYVKPDGAAATPENVDVTTDVAHTVYPTQYRPNRKLRREQQSTKGKKKRQTAFTKWLTAAAEKQAKKVSL